jgi:hypothetical protein
MSDIDRSNPEPIATGDRRDEVHFEPKGTQGVAAHFLTRPDSPPGPDMHSARVDESLCAEEGEPVEDLRVAPETPSVWDARPPNRA